MFTKPPSLLLLLLLTQFVPLSHCMSTFLIESGQFACVMIEAAYQTVLRMDYEALDNNMVQKEESASDPSSLFATLSVNVQSITRVHTTDLHEAPVRDHLKPTKELLKKTKDTIFHRMEINGVAHVCIQAPTTAKRAFRYALSIQTTEEVPVSMRKPVHTDKHLSHIETEMSRLTVAMQNIQYQTNFCQTLYADHFRHYQSMAATMAYWPMIQLCVLLMTGFTQARHVVEFFKTRRIF